MNIRVEFYRGSYINTHEVTLSTDEKGMVYYTVTGPSNTSATNDREDRVKFVELDSDGSATGRDDELRINWIEEDVFLASDSITLPTYVLEGTPSVSIKVHQWDQYGNPYRSHSKQQTEITVTGTQANGTDAIEDIGAATGVQASLMERRQVISRGYASWTPRVRVDAEDEIDVAYDVRQLARNSKGAAVRTGTGGVANFAAWVALGTSSAQSRMKQVDALLTTYNDARVLVSAEDENDAVPTVGAPAGTILHPDLLDDDNDGGTGELTDYADPRDTGNDPFVYGAPRNAPEGANAEWSDILTTDALDTYQDYGDHVSAKSAQGLVGDDDTVTPVIDNPDPGTSDGSDSVLVVDKANSADTGRYNVDLVGKTTEATEFLADTVGTEPDTNDTRPELVFSFDDDDIYLDNTKDEGRVITMKAFRTLLKDSTTSSDNEVEVLTYNVDGTSTFSVKENSAD